MCSSSDPPPVPVQAGQQVQQQQQEHPAPPAQQGQQIVHLNWSHFKLEFSGKPDEDAEAHLLHTDDWMTAHHFVGAVKVQRFCLTLLGEARLWYNSLELINIDWQGLQHLFRPQYSKVATQENNSFMCGDHLALMKTQNP